MYLCVTQDQEQIEQIHFLTSHRDFAFLVLSGSLFHKIAPQNDCTQRFA